MRPSAAGQPVAAAEFAVRMAPLGPFEPTPHFAVAVSGGADSMALALLAGDWVATRGGRLTALVVDHGLRAESAAEATATIARLRQRGIPAHCLPLMGLARGSALAERARAARYAVLNETCAAAGILHLLLGHHAGDQAETVAMRELSRSGSAGLAGMAALTETAGVRLLRPLLGVPPGRLRATLRATGVGWVEDPSNADPATLRARLRALRADPDGDGAETRAAVDGATRRGGERRGAEAALAAELAACASIHPEGYATLSGAISPPALAALVRTIGGAPYAPPSRQVERLAAGLGPATIAGVRVLRAADRLTAGPWLLAREASAMAAPVAARSGAAWDGRFRLGSAAGLPAGATLGALGPDAAALRRTSPLPAAVLRTLPALRSDGNLVAVPHLGYVVGKGHGLPAVINCAPVPVAGAPFMPCQGVGLPP
jgi:tRNA(Ile)-lysidine synthase